MKSAFYALITSTLLAAPQAFAWTQLANCGSGDAIAGLTVYTDGAALIVQIGSQDHTQAPVEYRSSYEEEPTDGFDANAEMNALSGGMARSYTLVSESSNAFGGAVSEAALLNIRVHKKFSFSANSAIAFQGQVVTMFCNQPKD